MIRNPILCFVLSLSIAVTLAAPGENVKKGLRQITPELMKKNIDFLASDSLQGRDTPSHGLELAADYIAGFMRDCGLVPAAEEYFQPFSMCSKDLADTCILAVVSNGIRYDYKIKSGFVPYENTGGNKVDGELFFAGYGITAPEYGYDDYKNTDVRGKVVLIFRHEPLENDSAASLFMGARATKYSNLYEKVKSAREHGAAGVIVVTEPLNYRTIRPRGFPWPSLSRILPKDALPSVFCENDEDSIPVVQVGEEVITAVFGSLDSLKKIQNLIDSTCRPNSFLIKGTRVILETPVRKMEKYTVKNVAGILPGSDPVLKDEFLVIGAHYDHVGISKEKKDGSDSICNGADDNASGTSGVLAVAKAMTSMKKSPARSTLFILFAGEEKGLLGSEYYVEHPLFPLEKTVAMLNMDMISRNSPHSLEIIGSLNCPDIATIIKKENRKTRFILKEKNMVGGSDHWNFHKKGIPGIHFFTGLHKDYHQVTDNPEKIDADKAARVARLVFETAWEIASGNQRYMILQGEVEESLF